MTHTPKIAKLSTFNIPYLSLKDLSMFWRYTKKGHSVRDVLEKFLCRTWNFDMFNKPCEREDIFPKSLLFLYSITHCINSWPVVKHVW